MQLPPVRSAEEGFQPDKTNSLGRQIPLRPVGDLQQHEGIFHGEWFHNINRGLGKKLVNHIVNSDDFKELRFWRLDTKDAHELYQKFGFKKPSLPERIMERRNITNSSTP